MLNECFIAIIEILELSSVELVRICVRCVPFYMSLFSIVELKIRRVWEDH